MIILDLIREHIFIVAVLIVIIYFTIRYLYNRGYLGKFGLDTIDLSLPEQDLQYVNFDDELNSIGGNNGVVKKEGRRSAKDSTSDSTDAADSTDRKT